MEQLFLHRCPTPFLTDGSPISSWKPPAMKLPQLPRATSVLYRCTELEGTFRRPYTISGRWQFSLLLKASSNEAPIISEGNFSSRACQKLAGKLTNILSCDLGMPFLQCAIVTLNGRERERNGAREKSCEQSHPIPGSPWHSMGMENAPLHPGGFTGALEEKAGEFLFLVQRETKAGFEKAAHVAKANTQRLSFSCPGESIYAVWAGRPQTRSPSPTPCLGRKPYLHHVRTNGISVFFFPACPEGPGRKGREEKEGRKKRRKEGREGKERKGRKEKREGGEKERRQE
ncbi:hypothetical protein L345_15907, partial [Ophiophagus hannah]